MAYDPNEQFTSTPGLSYKTCDAHRIRAITMAGGTGTVALLTPLAKHTTTGFYSTWIPGDANLGTIACFLWPDEHTLVTGFESITNGVFEGTILTSDIPLVGFTLTQLKTGIAGLNTAGLYFDDQEPETV